MQNVKAAKRLQNEMERIWDILEEVTEHPVPFERAPTLLTVWVSKSEPVLIDGKALLLAPLSVEA